MSLIIRTQAMREIMPHFPNLNDFQSPFFFFSNDSDAVLLYVSPSVVTILGYEPASMVGRRYTDFLVPEHPLNDSLSKLQTKRFAGDGIQTSFAVVYDTKQQVKILKWQSYGELNSVGRVVANHGLVQDVTEVYQLGNQLDIKLQHLDAIDSKLTAKEKRVLDLVLNGRLNKSIARELSVSERAIEMTRSRLMSKFNAETTAELIAKAVELRTLRSVLANRLLVA